MSSQDSQGPGSDNPAGFAHGSFAKPGAHVEPIFGLALDEAIAFAVQRAIDGGCTCQMLIHIGATGAEVLHDSGCPRLRTIGGRQ